MSTVTIVTGDYDLAIYLDNDLVDQVLHDENVDEVIDFMVKHAKLLGDHTVVRRRCDEEACDNEGDGFPASLTDVAID